MHAPDVSELLNALLAGERPPEPPGPLQCRLAVMANEEEVAPLVAHAATEAGWSSVVGDMLRPVVAAQMALSVVRARELRRVLDALHETGARPLLIKGAALEWTHYPAAGTRSRTDTDVLISEVHREVVRTRLSALGYQPLAHVTGTVAFSQFHFWRRDESGARHALDVHWRVVNPKLVADRLTHDELYRRRVPVPPLGPSAFTAASVDALQIACLHRVAHHHHSVRLLWLYDIHLLARSLTASDWRSLRDAVVERALEEFVHSGLAASAARFRTPVPPQFLEQLRDVQPRSRSDLAVFNGERARASLLLSDLRHTAGWPARARFLREHFLPSPTYMAHRYQTPSRVLLPFLYLHRLVSGARRYF